MSRNSRKFRADDQPAQYLHRLNLPDLLAGLFFSKNIRKCVGWHIDANRTDMKNDSWSRIQVEN